MQGPLNPSDLGACRRDLVSSIRVLLLASSVAAVAACSNAAHANGPGYGSGDPKIAAVNPEGGHVSPFLADGRAVVRALDAVEARSGKPLRVTTISADRASLAINVQEPANHVKVDKYVVMPDGQIIGPTPVTMRSPTARPITAAEVDQMTFDPRGVPFARLEQTAREAIAKTTRPDCRISQWEFDGIKPDDRRIMYLFHPRFAPEAYIDQHLRVIRIED